MSRLAASLFAVWRPNPRPDSVRAWVALRVCLLAWLGGAHAWGWFVLVVAFAAADYAVWLVRRREARA